MMNRVILVGRLTKDPELRYTPNGKAVVSFSLAVKRQFKNAQGEYEADFPNVVQWSGAENTANYLKKGSLAGVDGRIQTRSYEGQDGKRVYVTEVMAESVQFLEPKGNTNGQQNNSSQEQQKPNNSRVDNDPFAGGGSIDLKDEDLPF
jgi:single-strand DNA-binding protein